jgi:hypothetical protein
MRYRSRPARPARRASSGPPAWLVFLIGVALVFGLFYLWQGLQDFFRTGGRGVVEATERAQTVATATAVRVTSMSADIAEFTPRPSNTPIPDCMDFVVSVPNAIVREAPAANGAIVTSYSAGETVCVVGVAPEAPEWYVINRSPGTRRPDLVYMNETVIQAVNPTARPSRTPTPLPTVTPLPTNTRTPTPTPGPTQQPTETPDTRITLTPSETPTVTPTPTVFRQSA